MVDHVFPSRFEVIIRENGDNQMQSRPIPLRAYLVLLAAAVGPAAADRAADGKIDDVYLE